MRRYVPLLLTLAVEIAAVITLHRLWSPPNDSVGVVLWVTAVAGAWWLLGSTVFSVVAHLGRRAAALRASARLTLPVIRRFAERAVAASVVAGGLLITPTVASAQALPVPEPSVQTGDVSGEPEAPTDPVSPDPVSPSDRGPEPVIRTGRVGDPSARATITTEPPEPDPAEPTTSSDEPTPTDRGAASEGTSAPRPETPDPTAGTGNDAPPRDDPSPIPATTPATTPALPTPSAGTPAGTTPTPSYVVATGDNLWTIAAAQLAASRGRDVGSLGNDEITGYWRRLCDANRGRLRSGDVNLIYAGEIVELPPL